MDIYSLSIQRADGSTQSMTDFKGKTLLIVNVASQCGFTVQYEGLEKLYQKYKERGLVILGFPCNQFGSQEPGSDEEIQSFCTLNFGVTFPVLSKVEVNGAGTHPLYQLLKKEEPGILGTEGIKWNFTKFLVSKSGKVLKRFASTDKPDSLASEIEADLNS